ncbi:hypothetical protein J2Z83_000758 [Virgibacillus natechei]|uniref:Uncharacterized protein n=1 Tax=Virgibacillus natechei TaxID=1216297 RepID=A0ABS4IDZ1_9BACI|nr:hypothetical protein [Virgibacillus natechei]MBP1968666.1 hypothetical protein [Virgibacillus natechei]UZD13769.1 hypothetical protein OLD84_04235 [Virgibacillus natechei]
MAVSSLTVVSMCSFTFATGVSTNEEVESQLEENNYVTYNEEEQGYLTYNLELVNESTMELTVNNADITSNPNDSIEIKSHKTGYPSIKYGR